ncbi:Serine/threonine protein Kinase [Phytophthora cinnamomi]|uniref:Serine/threonine protein Kinase n=1 Tax=Phytophthora cinnamomi TaxID=4785 RepID=UPI00355A46DA|nr:Serine/threonine protein Kinase [Phytophthora cinnamomi]
MEAIPELLREVGVLCGKMKENEDLCRELQESAEFFWQHVEAMTQADKVAKQQTLLRYQRTLLKIRKALRKYYKRGLFIRIWGSYRVVDQLKALLMKLNDLYTAMGLQSFQTVEKIHTVVKKSHEDLKACAENVAAIRETLNEEGYKEGLVLLGVLSRFTDGSTSSRNMPTKQVELARRAFELAAGILRQRNEELPLIPKWFIPRDAVDFDDDTILDRGAYATAHVGKWGEDGLGTEVVVKCLVADDARAQEEFTRESSVWYGLDHPNIVRMYGACHVGLPIFFVCEYVKDGNFFTHFLEDKSHLWRLFYSAALGLRYLHENKVVHGDLKCNNILVDGDNAKICDFGFSYVRDRSQMSLKAQTTQIRWKAPEALMPIDHEPDSETNPRFASDVYSFGMCIIEAFQDGEPPFGTDDDETIMTKIFDGVPYPRPHGLQDDEWALVLRLCDHEWKARLTISDALRTLKMFADREAAADLNKPSALECLQCNIALPAGAITCWKCAGVPAAAAS